MTRWITRRQALGEMLAGTALFAAGCASGTRCGPIRTARRCARPIRIRTAPASLVPARGEPLRARTELGPAARGVSLLATIAHVTDAHVLDAESPRG